MARALSDDLRVRVVRASSDGLSARQAAARFAVLDDGGGFGGGLVTAAACLAAIRGAIEPDSARGLFASWAEKHDLLAPDVAAFASNRRQGSRGHA